MAFHRLLKGNARLSLWLAAAVMASAIWSGGSIGFGAEQRAALLIVSSKSTASTNSTGSVTQLLRGAPLKAPVFFADKTGTAKTPVKQASWYQYGYGYPSYAFYRGYGGGYGPWYGNGAYGLYGSPYSSFWGGPYRPYAYWPQYTYGLPYYYGWSGGYYPNYAYYGNPYYSSPYYGTPYYTSAYYPAYPGASLATYPPYGLAGYGGYGGFGGCCYW